MKSFFILACGAILASMASLPVLPQDSSKEPDPAATLDFLKRVDAVQFHYPGAGVHSLALKMKIGGNPMMPPEMREKLKDAAIVYYWQQEPWRDAIDVVGLPPEMAAMKSSMLGRGVGSMRHLVAHSSEEFTKRYRVNMSQDGELTKLEWSAKEDEKNDPPFSQWFDRNAKLVKGEFWSPQANKAMPVEFALVPLGARYAIAEIKQSAAEGGTITRIEWGKKGELPVPVKLTTVSGSIKLDFPLELEPNAKIDAAVFGAEKKQ